MKHEELIKKAASLGFKPVQAWNTTNANRTLAEVAISRDQRLWEAFPVMLANAGEAGDFDQEAALACLDGHEKDNFRGLMLASAALYSDLKMRFGWIKPAIAGFARGALNDYLLSFRENKPIRIGRETLQPQDLRACFITSYSRSEENLKAAAAARERVSLEYALSRLFPPRQKQLFLKKLKGEPLDKTEREYYSRVIKKKVQALANPDLHKLAAKALE